MAERHIIAGGELWGSPGALAFRHYLQTLTGERSPRICFLPTAAGDSDPYIAAFLSEMLDARCRPSVARLFDRGDRDLRGLLLHQDVIHVGGGNTANMLAVWRTHGVDDLLREAWESGVILTGMSAGANCWFEASVTDSFGPLSALRDGLGFLGGSYCPHYDSEEQRRPTFQRLVGEGFPAGYATDDAVALHFVGTELRGIMSAVADSFAYRLDRTADLVSEERIAPDLLLDETGRASAPTG